MKEHLLRARPSVFGKEKDHGEVFLFLSQSFLFGKKVWKKGFPYISVLFRLEKNHGESFPCFSFLFHTENIMEKRKLGN
jgi:hypothetical protein